MSETTTKPMSIAASFRNMWGIIAEAADRSRGQNADARYAAMFEAANKAQLWLATKSTLDALMNTCAKKDAEITKLKSQLEEARGALRKVVEAKMPGEARVIARSALEASNKEGSRDAV